MAQQKKGMLVKDDQGNFYFLRAEILAACKVSPEEIRTASPDAKKHMEALRSGEVSGYAMSAQLEPVGGLMITPTQQPGGDLSLASTTTKSTIMCPW